MKHLIKSSLAAGLLVASGVASAQTIGVGTGPQGSLTNRLGAAIAKVASDHAGINVLARPYSGNQQHVAQVNGGDLALGMNNIQEITAAVGGTEQFSGQKFPNMRVIARVIPIPVGMLVRKDSGITSIAQLKGKRVPVGYTSQQTVKGVIKALLAAGGLTEADVDGVLVPNTGKGTAAFKEGRADTAMSSLGGSRLQDADAAVGGIRVLPIPDDPAAVKGMQDAFPGAYVITMKPRKGLPGFEGPTRSMAYDFLVNASTHTPEETVYKITKALAENKEALVEVSGAFRMFDKTMMARPYDGIEYHSGAIRYYKEAGLWPPK